MYLFFFYKVFSQVYYIYWYILGGFFFLKTCVSVTSGRGEQSEMQLFTSHPTYTSHCPERGCCLDLSLGLSPLPAVFMFSHIMFAHILYQFIFLYFVKAMLQHDEIQDGHHKTPMGHFFDGNI